MAVLLPRFHGKISWIENDFLYVGGVAKGAFIMLLTKVNSLLYGKEE